MVGFLKDMSRGTKGFLLMVTGAVLLLNTLGIIKQGLSSIIIIGSVIMLVVGFMMIDGHTKIQKLLSGKKD